MKPIKKTLIIRIISIGMFGIFGLYFWVFLPFVPPIVRKESTCEPRVDLKTRGESIKRILIWNPFSVDGDWFAFYGTPEENTINNCIFSKDKSTLHESDAILIDALILTVNPWSLPESRFSNQIWILHTVETPRKIIFPFAWYNGVFNWTSLIRLDSDVPSFYGKISPKIGEKERQKDRSSHFDVKTKNVAWVASNCVSDNNREGYIEELGKYIHVDRYGDCGNMTCPSNNCSNILSKYKFYLAFENSNCRDYVSEKFWRTLKIESIPVVMGGADYTKIAPPGSYINVMDYKSPRELAKYLKTVAQNRSLFNSYFKWHTQYTLHYRDGQYWRDICRTLNLKGDINQVYHNLQGWYEDDTCTELTVMEYIYRQFRHFKAFINL